MSRHIATTIRTLALATLTLAGITACDDDGPVEPKKLPNAQVSASNAPTGLVKNKPQLYFVGILFSGGHDAPSGEIYSMEPNGSNIFRLTNDDVTDQYPEVSPTGPSFIWARFSANGQTSEIYSQNLDGSKRKRLTFMNTVAIHPRYSPDGSKIAFTAEVPGVGGEIFVMNADGTGIIRLTTTGNNSKSPSWSPDGTKIAFQSSGNSGFGSVWVMTASGGNQLLVKDCPSPGCQHPKWNPLTNEIAVERADGTQISVIDATTGAQTGYIPPSLNDYDIMPTWTKDGKQIVFSSLRGHNGTYDLFITEPMRRTMPVPPPVTRLTTLLGEEFAPAYSK